MSVTIRVRQYRNGQADDEVVEHADGNGVAFGYSLAPDNSFRVLAVSDAPAATFSGRKVDVVKVYSAAGYLEVSGTRMVSDFGLTEDEMAAVSAPQG